MKHTLIIASTVACAVLMAGCGGDDNGSDAESWRPDPSVPAEPGSDGFTPPDAVLALGDTAIVPVLDEGMMDDPDVTGSLEVTVTEVPTEGARDELPTDQPFLDDAEGAPHYVTFSVKNVGESDLGGTVIRMLGVDTAGDDLDTWASSSFTPCAGGLPESFGPGETATSCSVVFVEDDDLAAVGYGEAAAYEDDAVLWDLT